jgi:hypothetical protein
MQLSKAPDDIEECFDRNGYFFLAAVGNLDIRPGCRNNIRYQMWTEDHQTLFIQQTPAKYKKAVSTEKSLLHHLLCLLPNLSSCKCFGKYHVETLVKHNEILILTFLKQHRRFYPCHWSGHLAIQA